MCSDNAASTSGNAGPISTDTDRTVDNDDTESGQHGLDGLDGLGGGKLIARFLTPRAVARSGQNTDHQNHKQKSDSLFMTQITICWWRLREKEVE